MSFENCLPQMFSRESIHKNAPAASGVYGLSNARRWLFIGETDNIRASLLEHLSEPAPKEPDREPVGYSFESVGPADRVARQQYLIGELSPAYQRRTAPRRHGRIRRGLAAT